MEQRFLYKSYFVFCIMMRLAISFLKSKNFQLFVKKKFILLYPDRGIYPLYPDRGIYPDWYLSPAWYSLQKISQARCPRLRTGQVKFHDCKPDWACKIVKSKLKKYWAKQTRMPFFKSKQGQIHCMQILLIRDTNGCHCWRRLWHINHIKISKLPIALA